MDNKKQLGLAIILIVVISTVVLIVSSTDETDPLWMAISTLALISLTGVAYVLLTHSNK